MSSVATRSHGSYVDRPSSASLADVVALILDKGLVIDAFVRVSLVGIEILTIDARIVIASVDTFLRFAEATNRLDLQAQGGKDLPELVEGMTQAGARGKTGGMLSGAKEALLGNKDDDDDEGRRREEKTERRTSSKADS
ncbi:gas vesicle protein GvpJ [Georgenia thermotolerans]|uniref:Gas vesicle protein A n=1 Tax=Georgenia thermotolerans TaxID=527326 RepID=A0A7J5UND6_9MICO|nr:gas vesicle protein GvpJ [Georgenia thermotolerans]KAE8763908.1 gas vesicle structural protein GvpA [Georgenia thermotolerans]